MLFSFISCSTLISPAFAIPRDFTCKPLQYYSGGFDVFYVTEITASDGSTSYHGTRYWQATSPHGILIGKPGAVQEYTLVTYQVDSTLQIDGFSNSVLEGELPTLPIPAIWNSGTVNVKCDLFYNEINGSEGLCSPGKDPRLN